MLQENKEEMKLNRTEHFIVNADDINLLSECINTIDTNTKVPLDSSKEVGLQQNVDVLRSKITLPFYFSTPQYMTK